MTMTLGEAMTKTLLLERAEKAERERDEARRECERHRVGAEEMRAEVDAAKSELGLAGGGVGLSLAVHVHVIKAERDAALAQVEALKKYATHRDYCAYLGGGDCNCGFAAIPSTPAPGPAVYAREQVTRALGAYRCAKYDGASEGTAEMTFWAALDAHPDAEESS